MLLVATLSLLQFPITKYVQVAKWYTRQTQNLLGRPVRVRVPPWAPWHNPIPLHNCRDGIGMPDPLPLGYYSKMAKDVHRGIPMGASTSGQGRDPLKVQTWVRVPFLSPHYKKNHRPRDAYLATHIGPPCTTSWAHRRIPHGREGKPPLWHIQPLGQ